MPVNRPGLHTDARRSPTPADIANGILAFIARVSAVVFGLSLVYLVYAVFSGALRQYPYGYTVQLSNQLTANVHLASECLFYSSVAGSVSLVLLLWGWEVAGVLFAIAGGIMYAALPYFGVPFLSEASRNLARANHPGYELLMAFRVSGIVFLISGGLLLAFWAWELLRTSLSAPRRAGGGLRLPFYSPCWQTHYCRDELNKLCAPGRKGYRKSCWRHKSGCMCDESIADRVLSDARKKMGNKADMWLGAPAKAPAPVFSDRFRLPSHKVANQKVACSKCPIYALHEIQKHRILSPILLLGIPALMFYQVENMHRWYMGMVNAVDRFTLHLAFDPTRTAAMQSQVRVALDLPAIEWMVYGIVALFLVTLSAWLLEYWCFTAKL